MSTYTLTDRRLKLSLQYAVKLYSTPKNPAFSCVVRPRFRHLYADKPSAIKPLGLRIKPHLEAAHIDLSLISQNLFQVTLLGCSITPRYILSFLCSKRVIQMLLLTS